LHLCSWQTLSRPKSEGGWGLKNLCIFNKALLASSFWRAISIDNIWHRIIKDKYLNAKPLSIWLRKPHLTQSWASPFLEGIGVFLSGDPALASMESGIGKEIKLGRDKLIGLDDCSILSLQLRSLLLSHNISSLAQLKKGNCASHLPDYWLHSSDLASADPQLWSWTLSRLP
jgi:hypothetical protein